MIDGISWPTLAKARQDLTDTGYTFHSAGGDHGEIVFYEKILENGDALYARLHQDPNRDGEFEVWYWPHQ